MTEDDNVQKIKRWKPMSKRPIGRPKTRWEDNVLEDIKSMNIRNWRKWHGIEIVGRQWLSKPEPCIGCSALQEEEEEEEEEERRLQNNRKFQAKLNAHFSNEKTCNSTFLLQIFYFTF
jgi:hypothetical protein